MNDVVYDAIFKEVNKKNVIVEAMKAKEKQHTTSLLARVAYIAMNPAAKKMIRVQGLGLIQTKFETCEELFKI